MQRRECSQFFRLFFVDSIAYTQNVIIILQLDLDCRSTQINEESEKVRKYILASNRECRVW